MYALTYAAAYVTARIPMPMAPDKGGKGTNINWDGLWTVMYNAFGFIVGGFAIGLALAARKNAFKDTMESSGNMSVAMFWIAIAAGIVLVINALGHSTGFIVSE